MFGRFGAEVSLKMCTSSKCAKEHEAVTKRNNRFLPEVLQIRQRLQHNLKTMTEKDKKSMLARLRTIVKGMTDNKESDAYGRCIVDQCQQQLRGMMKYVHAEQEEECKKGHKRACDLAQHMDGIMQRDKITAQDRKSFVNMAVSSSSSSATKTKQSSKTKTKVPSTKNTATRTAKKK
jgi:hypothetical protein